MVVAAAPRAVGGCHPPVTRSTSVLGRFVSPLGLDGGVRAPLRAAAAAACLLAAVAAAGSPASASAPVAGSAARALVTPSPSDPTSPDPGASTPATGAGPTTDPASPDPSASEPLPSETASGTSGATTTPAPSTGGPAPEGAPSAPGWPSSTSTGPTTVTEAPLPPAPPSDGRLPDPGVHDAYLDAARAHGRATAALAAARSALAVTDRLIGSVSAQAREAQLDAAIAQQRTQLAQDDVDDLVRELYQNGDASMQSLAFVLTSGPDAFLLQLQGIAAVRAEAARTVDLATSTTTAAREAGTREQAALDRLQTALELRRVQDAAVHRAYRSVRAADALLARLGTARPQTTVGPEGCPEAAPLGTLRGGSGTVGVQALCRSALRAAATPQAALAVTWALQRLGAAYACGGTGRLLPFRADCSSFVSRAYAEGAGLRTAGDGWAPSTRDMVPWDGARLDPHYAYVEPAALRPGDLVLYDTCPQGGCPNKHVVMYLGAAGGQEWMVHTDSCGDVAKIEPFWGFPATGPAVFLVARRVLALPGEQMRRP